MSQQPHPYRTNRDLFSNHYLTEHLRQTEPWEEVDQDEVREAYDEIREIWTDKQGRVADYNEAQLERNFIRPIFDILGIPFEIEETVMRNARRPDYGFFPGSEAADAAFDRDDFYEEAIAVADAKRWGRKLDTRGEEKRDFENPSYQIHAYLQETPPQWAVLTNGKQWRIYYGPTSHRLDSYYEIDLPELFEFVEEDGGIEDFKDFYLFFRQQAFLPDQSGDCFLDDVYDESSVFAEAIGEDLQNNIYEAIRVLAEGFLDTNDNLEEDDLPLIHDSSLIYLYRLIFVLYAESEGRDLLPTDNDIYSESYSLNELKQTVADRRDETQQHYQTWQTNLWDRLEELFVLIDQGSQGKDIPKDQLYIPAYNGGLFRTSPDPDDSAEAQFLATHEADDAHLAEVIDLLTRRDADEGDGQVFVDYSSLDERHLGSIYEGLLEYKLDVADEPLTVEDEEYSPADDGDEIKVEEGDVYLRTDAGERKATGSYYTPEYVVEYIVDETLGPLVDGIREDLVGTESYDQGGFAGEFADRVFNLKVLDPAMGSGHFLVNAVDYLAREIIDAQERQDQQAVKRGDEDAISDPRTEDGELRDINWARRKVAQRCIYGVDLNPLATELAKVSLWLRTLAAEQPLAFLDHHLKTGNSLVGSDIEDILGDSESDVEDGQLTLQQSFAHTRQKALEHVMGRFQNLLSIDNETLADIKEMEEVYDQVREDPLYQHLLAMANVHTAEVFGLNVPGDAHERMAEALRSESWDKIEAQDWFRTAQAMAEDEQFFHWELEFPVAFYDENGERLQDAGFDGVIGNPPYVKIQNIREQDKSYFNATYDVARERYDLYGIFVEQADKLGKDRIGLILPNKFFEARAGQPLRDYLENVGTVDSIIDFNQNQVFKGATTYTCLLFLAAGSSSSKIRYGPIEDEPENGLRNIDWVEIDIQDEGEKWNLTGKVDRKILAKIEDTGQKLEKISKQIQVGVQTSANKTFVLHDCEQKADIVEGYSKALDENVTVEAELTHPFVTDNEVSRYSPPSTTSRLIYPYSDNGEILPEDKIEEQFPLTYRYLNNNKTELQDRGSENQVFESWYAHWCPRHPEKFERSKILVSQVVKHGQSTYDYKGDLYFSSTVYSPILKDEYEEIELDLLGILNSSLVWYYITKTGTVLRGGYYRYKTEYLNPIGIPVNGGSEDLHELVSDILTWTRERTSLNTKLLDYLGNYVEGPKLPDIGLFQPTDSNILDATTDDYDSLRVGDVRTERNGRTVSIYVTARYKPEDEDEYETDQWGYTETDYLEAFSLTDLSDKEAALVESFVTVAVEEAGGFANFRDSATKNNSLIDRLKTMTLPNIDNVQDDLERYIETKNRAEELDEKMEKADQSIDEIVYELYDLTEEEIEIVEDAVNGNN